MYTDGNLKKARINKGKQQRTQTSSCCCAAFLLLTKLDYFTSLLLRASFVIVLYDGMSVSKKQCCVLHVCAAPQIASPGH